MAAARRLVLAAVLVAGLVGCDRTDRSFGDSGVVRVAASTSDEPGGALVRLNP